MNQPKTIPLSEFVENPDNPSAASEEVFARLVEKIRRYPDGLAANRIAYITDDSRFPGKKLVLSGNKRLRALNQIASEGGLILYGESKISPDGRIPADWTEDITSMTTEQRRIYLVAANVVEGEWDVAMLKELYTPEELAPLVGDDVLDSLLAEVQTADLGRDAVDHDSEIVELAITLPADDYRHAYLALVSRNEDIGRALMEVVDAE